MWRWRKRRVADLPHASYVALPVVLLSARPQLLLGQRHLLLHVGDLLLGSAAVLLRRREVRRSRSHVTAIAPFPKETKKGPTSANISGRSHLSAFPRLFHAVEHGPQLGQPLALHRRHALHVLLHNDRQAEASASATDGGSLSVSDRPPGWLRSCRDGGAGGGSSPWWS